MSETQIRLHSHAVRVPIRERATGHVWVTAQDILPGKTLTGPQACSQMSSLLLQPTWHLNILQSHLHALASPFYQTFAPGRRRVSLENWSIQGAIFLQSHILHGEKAFIHFWLAIGPYCAVLYFVFQDQNQGGVPPVSVTPADALQAAAPVKVCGLLLVSQLCFHRYRVHYGGRRGPFSQNIRKLGKADLWTGEQALFWEDSPLSLNNKHIVRNKTFPGCF